MNDDQRLYAAAASSRDNFCIAVVNQDIEDPHSIVLSYDGALAQPWGRADMPRIVNDIAVTDDLYVALSNEGDVYTLLPDGAVTEKIPGAGTHSPDATGLGATIGIAAIGGVLHVVGDSGQIYRRDAPATWTSLGGPGLEVSAPYSSVTLRVVAGTDPELIYVAGFTTLATRLLTPAETEEMAEAGKRGDVARMVEIVNSLIPAGVDPTKEGRAFFRDASGWTEIARPNRHGLHDILVESQDKVWITGFNGTILRGNASAGFQEVGFHGDTERILSFTRFGDRYACAADHSLHWFNDHNLSPLRPTSTVGVLSPLKVIAADDVLFFFDYRQGVHRFDGKAWTEIKIPPSLLSWKAQEVVPP